MIRICLQSSYNPHCGPLG